MNCIVPAANVKVISKALQALSKVGDEFYIEARRDSLSFIAINLSKTVCARFEFYDSFFSSYEVDENELNDENKQTVTCKLQLKTVLPLFKGNLEKKLDFIKFDYETDSDFIDVKMKYKGDGNIVMLHKRRLMESGSLTIGISTDSGSNNVCAPSSFFSQLLTMFCTSDDEMTFEVSKSKLIARNYCVGLPCRPKTIRSQVNLQAAEFALYNIPKETTVNFSLRPFRTAVQFADIFNMNIGFNFETGGRPLSMIMKSPTFQASLIVATMNPNSDMQSSLSSSSIPSKVIPNPNRQSSRQSQNPNLTIEDRQALEHENWDNFETDEKDSNEAIISTNEVARRDESIGKTSRNGSEMFKSKSSKTDNSFTEMMNRALDTLSKEKCGNGSVRSGSKRSVSERSGKENDDCDVIPESPESPRTKLAKVVFGRCLEPTFRIDGDVLAEDSDPECDPD